MPRFDDGMVNIQELIRIMAESIVDEVMDAQAEDACADGNRRNGYRERSLMTSVGVINLCIPKLRREVISQKTCSFAIRGWIEQ